MSSSFGSAVGMAFASDSSLKVPKVKSSAYMSPLGRSSPTFSSVDSSVGSGAVCWGGDFWELDGKIVARLGTYSQTSRQKPRNSKFRSVKDACCTVAHVDYHYHRVHLLVDLWLGVWSLPRCCWSDWPTQWCPLPFRRSPYSSAQPVHLPTLNLLGYRLWKIQWTGDRVNPDCPTS